MFGLLTCDESINLGDDIQYIATSKFLPKIDCIIDRNTSKIKPETTSILNTIYNGWFHSAYCQFPIPTPIKPLFISFHLNDTGLNSSYNFLKDKEINQIPIANQVDFFKKHEPIGCRDYHTVELLQKNGIDAYFSGCMTLTLKNPFLETERTDEILVVDAHILNTKLFYSLIPKEIQKRAKYITQVVYTTKPYEEKKELATAFLNRLAKAKVVITSRLHTTLPCLALKTPVIFIASDLEDVRYKTYLKYVKHFTDGDIFDVDIDAFRNPDATELFSIVSQTENKLRKWVNDITHSKDLELNEIKRGYSIVSVSMNRNSFLEKALPTWVASEPDEIVIIDWNTTGNGKTVEEIISMYTSRVKIKLLKVDNVSQWSLTRSFNLAFRATSFDKVLKLDADNKLNKDFFLFHNLDMDKIFFSGDWRKARNDNEIHTNGILYVKRADFFSVGGYNELIQGYGYDDSDIYLRLGKIASQHLICLDLVSHIPHSNELRIENTKNKNRLDIEIEKNRLISQDLKWDGVMSKFDICQLSENYFISHFVSGQQVDEKTELQFLNKAKNLRKPVMKEKKFYVQPKNGLGNRLRCLASAFVIAKNTNRKLIVIWSKDDHCQASFFDLFKPNFITDTFVVKDNVEKILDKYTIINETHHQSGDFIGNEIHQSGNETQIIRDINKKKLYPDLDYYNYAIDKYEYIDDTSSDDIYVVSACVLNNRNTNWYQESIFLRHLVPIDTISSKVFQTEFMNNNFKNVIGVHIRMGQDPKLYNFEDISKYNEKEKNAIQKWRKCSHWSFFVEKMTETIKLNPNQKFYVSADNKDIYDQLGSVDILKGKIITTPRKEYDRSTTAIQLALVDILLLSKCKSILGSNWSSFSEIASKIGMNKIQFIGK